MEAGMMWTRRCCKLWWIITLCKLCTPLLNHRNEKGSMALHTAATQGNDILVTALLVAGAGFIFTFILN
jgi:hypothetical protein